MRNLQRAGIRRGKAKRTTFPGEVAERPQDLVDRVFAAVAPNRLWVAHLTTSAPGPASCTWLSWPTAFSRRIVGWRVSASLHAELALDALEMAIWSRRAEDLSSLVHHSDRGVQYLAIRYTERLAEAGAVRSVGSRGDSYDNALAVFEPHRQSCLKATVLVRQHMNATTWRGDVRVRASIETNQNAVETIARELGVEDQLRLARHRERQLKPRKVTRRSSAQRGAILAW